QKLAWVFSRTSSAVGSRQCLATRVSYSTHMRQTCSSERQALHSSSRRSGSVSSSSEAPHFQQARPCPMAYPLKPLATIYTSRDSLREAPGLRISTFSKDLRSS